MTIGFWKAKTRPELSMSHAKGLDESQIQMLQQLKPGDRLVLWVNGEKDGPNRPDFTLKVMVE
jgi:hypothetical protein